jgi:crotonobetainyl-CoA:carnitine CoA-transferase CaiB-like acyl-CoA transferase
MILDTPQPRTGNTGYSALPTAGLFDARDGKRISLGVVQQNQFEALCKALGRLDLLEDPRFAQLAVRNRPENHAPLKTIIQAEFLMHDAEELSEQLTAGNVPAGVIREVIEVVRDPFLVERGIAVPMTIAGLPEETVRVLTAGFLFSEDGPRHDGPPPWLGEHSVETLRELEFSPEEIARMIEAGVVQTRAVQASEEAA